MNPPDAARSGDHPAGVPPLPGLRRSIGLGTVVATSAGLTFASSTFLAVVQMGALLAGDALWIAVLVAGALCALAAAAFSELNGMLPSVNGIRLYVYRAFGETASLVVALTYMSVTALVVGAEAYVLSHVLAAALPAVAPPVWIFLMLTLAAGANLLDLKIAGGLQSVITYSVATSIAVMSVLALARAQFHVRGALHPGGLGPTLQAVSVGIFLFVGFEWVTPLADEVRSPRSIPVGMMTAVGLLVAVYALVATAMFAGVPGLPRAALTGGASAPNPIPHVTFAAAALGPAGRWCMIATSLCMSLTTFNAGLIGISRFLYGMARDQVLPRSLASLSRRFNTPDRAVAVVYVVGLAASFAVYWSQKYLLLVNTAAATEAFVYALAAAAVVALRRKEAGRDRPFRMAGGVWLPALTAVVFALLGVGVFLQPRAEFWGAAVVIGAAALGWWAYVRWSALPRLKALRAARGTRRPSRRPGAT